MVSLGIQYLMDQIVFLEYLAVLVYMLSYYAGAPAYEQRPYHFFFLGIFGEGGYPKLLKNKRLRLFF